MTRLRPLLRDVTIYGIGDAALRATALVSLPIYARALSTNEYGAWATLQTIGLLAAGLLILGGDSAFARLWFDASDHRERRTLTSTWLTFLALTGAAGFAAALLFAPLVAVHLPHEAGGALGLAAALLIAPFTVLGSICGQALRNERRARLLAVHNLTTALAALAGGLIGGLVLHGGVLGILLGHAAGLAALLPVRLVAIRHLLAPTFSITLLRRLLSFGVPLVPMTVAYWVFTTSDRLLLTHYTGLHAVGLYSVAVTLTGVLAIANSAFGQAWSPHALAAYRTDEEAARRYFGTVCLLLVAVVGTLAVAGTVFADGGLRLVASGRYAEAEKVVAPLALAAVALISTQVTAAGISITKRTRHFGWIAWGAAGVNLGLNLLFIPRYGMVAAAATTAVAYVALTLAYHAVGQRLWPIRYPSRRLLATIAVVTTATLAAGRLPDAPTATNLLLKLGYLAVVALVLLALVQPHVRAHQRARTLRPATTVPEVLQ